MTILNVIWWWKEMGNHDKTFFSKSVLIDLFFRDKMFNKPTSIDDIKQGMNIDLEDYETAPHTTTATVLQNFIDLIVKPLDKDGNPIQGANIILKCGSPPKRYSGIKQNDGTYLFKDAIPQSGREECTMIIEAPG